MPKGSEGHVGDTSITRSGQDDNLGNTRYGRQRRPDQHFEPRMFKHRRLPPMAAKPCCCSEPGLLLAGGVVEVVHFISLVFSVLGLILVVDPDHDRYCS